MRPYKTIGSRNVIFSDKKYIEINKAFQPNDYRALEDILPNSAIRGSIAWYNKKKYLCTKELNRYHVYKSIAQFLANNRQDMFRIMYLVPFKELPFHINEKNLECLTVIKWRLIIGK